jgi:hypothetical protein
MLKYFCCFKSDKDEVALFYFQTGHSPSHYKNQKVKCSIQLFVILFWLNSIFKKQHWDALLRIEMSQAIKCPSISSILVGTKRVQHFLFNDENNLKTIFDNDLKIVESMKNIFGDSFILDNDVIIILFY